jgi:hypothetical protein
MTQMDEKLKKRQKKLQIIQKTNRLYYAVSESETALLLENPYYQSPSHSDSDKPAIQKGEICVGWCRHGPAG